MQSRTDTSALWENFIIAERMKFLHYSRVDAKMYFWRTAQQQEIDLIEEHEAGLLKAFEFKWGKTEKGGSPKHLQKIIQAVKLLLFHQII